MILKGNDTSKKMLLRNGILVALCLQNAGYTLIQILKMIISIYLTLTDNEPTNAQGRGLSKLAWLTTNSGKMLILAAIYGAMNILSFVALQYIGAGEFTICAQLKILTTAGFSVIVLGTSLSSTRWRALALLVLGCVLVASPNFSNSKVLSDSYLQLLGYGAVLTEVVLSGFASIYFEKVVKSTTEVITIWERNYQLGLYSILMYVGIIIYEESTKNNDRVAWSNWSFLTFLVALFGAGGGLLVAATLKYADSILKTLAAAGAIVLSTVLGHIFLNGPLDLIVGIGGMVTIIAISNYTLDTTPPPSAISTSNSSK